MASFNHSENRRGSHSFTKSKSDTGGIPKVKCRKQKSKSLIEPGTKNIDIDETSPTTTPTDIDQTDDNSNTNCNNLGFDLRYRFLFRSFRRSISKKYVINDSSSDCMPNHDDKINDSPTDKSKNWKKRNNKDKCSEQQQQSRTKLSSISKFPHPIIDFRMFYYKLQRHLNKGILTTTF